MQIFSNLFNFFDILYFKIVVRNKYIKYSPLFLAQRKCQREMGRGGGEVPHPKPIQNHVLNSSRFVFWGISTGEKYFTPTIQYSVEHNPLKTVTLLSSLVNRGTVQSEHHKQQEESIIVHTSPLSSLFPSKEHIQVSNFFQRKSWKKSSVRTQCKSALFLYH